MKAIAIDGFGGVDELRKRGLPRPDPGEGEVRIRVVAAGVAALDAVARRGETGPRTFPWVPGFEAAGTVDALGPGCGRFRQGDKVMALLPDGGGYAEYAIVDENLVAKLPASLLFEEAAALVLDGIAAWNGWFDGPEPLDGTRDAVVLDAAGGAGHLAVQMALACGARVVAGTDPDRRRFVEELGRVDWLDPGATAGPGRKVFDGTSTELQAAVLTRNSPRQALSDIASMVTQRRLRPRLFKILNIGRANEAHELIESGAVCGKLALTF